MWKGFEGLVFDSKRYRDEMTQQKTALTEEAVT